MYYVTQYLSCDPSLFPAQIIVQRSARVAKILSDAISVREI